MSRRISTSFFGIVRATQWHVWFSLQMFVVLAGASPTLAEQVVVQSEMAHLRIDGPREWSTFSESPDASQLELKFECSFDGEAWLQIRHVDVKQQWIVELNGEQIGKLKVDENAMTEYFSIPAGVLRGGENQLSVFQKLSARSKPDDIRIGDIIVGAGAVSEHLSQASVRVSVREGSELCPARITVVNSSGALQTVGNAGEPHLAIRPGIVYTSTGRAEFGLPAGSYTIIAGRGFEYSIDSASIAVEESNVPNELTFEIVRQVDTRGYVACDTHVHTLTHSGHGDATVEERMVTLAGEGIELPIATDHNVQIDYRPYAAAADVSEHFTPVIGNEVTTKVGHFNIWPLSASSGVPNHRLDDWGSILEEIYATSRARVAILNHARDVHGTTPFGPAMYNAVAAENLDGWPIRFNAMEVVNSGATQTDAMQLFRDWMSLLNAGYNITPVGCSDSHDVGRHFVGQGRTYIRCDDRDPGNIDVERATTAFLNGEVLVSYGLLCEMTVNDVHRSGAFVQPTGDSLDVAIRVSGPEWTSASEVTLFANGTAIRTEVIGERPATDGEETAGETVPGVHAVLNWTIPIPDHDVHLTAIATGPGIASLHWPTAKPYLPDSPDWTPKTIGCSGALWVDGDRNGRRSSAADYATSILAAHPSVNDAVNALSAFDRATAIQTLHRLRLRVGINDDGLSKSVSTAADHVREAYDDYRQQWRTNEIARSEGR